MIIALRDKETGSEVGSINEEQLRFLVDQLEEEFDEDRDYYINQGTVDVIEQTAPIPSSWGYFAARSGIARALKSSGHVRTSETKGVIPMYGTIWRVRPKTGREQETIQMMEEWEQERRPKVQGVMGSLLFKLDNGGLMGVAVFDSKENYQKNAEDPEQDAWYRRWRDTVESDPEWNDGEIIGSWGSISR